MFSTLAVGEPSLGRFTGGGFDLTPLLVTAVVLLLLKIIFGFRMRWQLVLGTLLAAPLLAGVAGRISFPLTTALTLASVGIVSFIVRRGGASRGPGMTGRA